MAGKYIYMNLIKIFKFLVGCNTLYLKIFESIEGFKDVNQRREGIKDFRLVIFQINWYYL